ncbi:coatomer subunit beta [Pancytospora epiphaga]|nr:coatomer subunit beta [Pancytospora epiphaga]
MGQTLLIDHEKLNIDQKFIDKNPEAALKHMISIQANGGTAKEFLHCVIRSVVPKNDNSLKRLLYYYLETLGDDSSLVICLNQISKDLESPNEYVRGLVLNFISTLKSVDYVTLLLKGIRSNLYNKNSYVRMTALSCLSVISERFDIDIEEELTMLAKQEASPEVLKVLFHSMHHLGVPIEPYLNMDYSEDVLDFLVDFSSDLQFLLVCARSKYPGTVFKASSRILQSCINEEMLGPVNLEREAAGKEAVTTQEIRRMCVENVLRILDSDPSFRMDFIPTIKYVDGHAVDLLSLLDIYEPEYSQCLIDQAFSNAETHEFFKVAEILRNLYIGLEPTSEKKRAFKILLLNNMARFVSSHCLYIPEMIQSCLDNMSSLDTELVYASLCLLYAIVDSNATHGDYDPVSGNSTGHARDNEHIVGRLMEIFSQLWHGKILRFIFDIIGRSINKTQFNALLDILLDNFNKPTKYLKECEVFIGTHICLALVNMYNNEWDCKAKTVATIVNFLQYGNKHGTIDISSRATVSLCARSILDGSKAFNNGGASQTAQTFSKVETLSPLKFLLLPEPWQVPKFKWSDPLDTCTRTVQLSGLGDPLYVEANMVYNRYELVLDLLIINQTEYYLQDINFEFLSSKYLKQVIKPGAMSLQPSSANTAKISFSIEESSSCFISITSIFKFPKQQEYSTTFVQNLSDISIDIGQFLSGASLDFKRIWQDLEWENIYSLSLNKTNPDVLLEHIIAMTGGVFCDRYCTSRFLVANISCVTTQHSPVLLNICFSSGEGIAAEIRVRSKDEDVVKTISLLISNGLKAVK